MATTNYSWNLPTVGGSEDTWGTDLNANWTSLDTLLGGTNATEFAILDGATVTTAELNILDGVTATAAEINLLDGVTASTAELNILDGITATTTELNYVDGVTSSIQDQLDGSVNRLVQLSRTVISGSPSVIDIVFDPSLYDEIIITLCNVETSLDSNSIEILTSSDGGSTFDNSSGNYRYERTTLNAGAFSFNGSSSANEILLTNAVIGNDAGEEGLSGEIKIFGPGLSKRTRVFSNISFVRSNGTFTVDNCHGERTSSADVDAVRLALGGGTFSAGIVAVHGLLI